MEDGDFGELSRAAHFGGDPVLARAVPHFALRPTREN
jgi:hypothetical protein